MDPKPAVVALTSAAKPRALTVSAWRNLSRDDRRRLGRFVLYTVIVTVAFIYPLARLMSYAATTELHSHVPLVPLVSGYLLHVRHGKAGPAAPYQTSVLGAVALGIVSVLALLAFLLRAPSLSLNDGLALTTLSWISAIAAGGFLLLGARWMSAAAFPFAFLLFMVPMPDAVTGWLEYASMRASADMAAAFIELSGTPMVRDGTLLQVPGILLRVAEECSGIRSSWVLFITSLVASDLFLRTSWRRLVLVAFVIPLGVVRNGFRILVIALVCVHIGPHMIDSAIHRRGGPLFFVLSLGPLFLLLWWLRRGER